MPDLATELAHLEQADRHIAQARELIAKALEEAEASRPQGPGEQIGVELLATMEATLVSFEAHRALIIRTIADIRAGALPST